MKNSSYWQNRSNARMAKYHRNSDKTIATVNKAYDKAVADIEKDIRKIHDKFAIDGKLSPAEARKLLNSKISGKEFNKIKDQIKYIKDPDIKRELLSIVNAPAYKARITKLEALKQDVYIKSKQIADIETQLTKSQYIDTIHDAYYKNIYDIQKGVGYGFHVSSMPMDRVQAILSNPWSGKHFSSRIWRNTDVLAEQLTNTMISGFLSGRSIERIARELREYTEYGKYASERLVRTETTFMANSAEVEAYRECDIEKYIYIATLDLRTSDICQGLDKKEFNTKDAVAGINLPPMHPYCRSTTRAKILDETAENMKRRADPVTGKTYLIPSNMNYGDWYKEYVVNNGKSDIIKRENNKLNYPNITSIKEAEEWAKLNLGLTTVSYNGIDVDVANYVNKSMYEIYEEYPLLNGFVQEIKTDGRMEATASANLSFKNGKLLRVLKLSKKELASLKDVNDMIKECVDSKWWAPKDGIKGIIKHELGHMIEYALTLKNNNIINNKSKLINIDNIRSGFNAIKKGEISKDIKLRALSNLGLLNTKQTIKNNLSEYSYTLSAEFLAEAVSEHEPRDLAKETVRLLKDRIKEVWK